MSNGEYPEAEGSGPSSFFLGLLTGLVLGGIAVMLYAPRSGPETQNLLRDEVNKTQQMLQNWSNDIKQRADGFAEAIRFGAER
jgi:gas vesicle protein